MTLLGVMTPIAFGLAFFAWQGIKLYYRSKTANVALPESSPKSRAAHACHRLQRMQIGDLIGWPRPKTVTGIITLIGHCTWREYLICSSRMAVHYVSVTRNWEQLTAAAYTMASRCAITPGETELEYGGVKYSRIEDGISAYRTVGQTGLKPDGRVYYYDYSDGQRLITFLSFDNGPWMLLTGRVLPLEDIAV